MKLLTSLSLLLACAAVNLQAGEEKPEMAKAVNLEKINTDADEDDPFLQDAQNLYYASNQSGKWEIMLAKRAASSNPWPAGKSYLSNKEADVRSPFLRGNVLYFATNKVPDEKVKDLKNYDLLQKSGGLAPTPLIGISEKEDELHPWITSTGKEFYFSRKLKDGWTMFVAQGPVPGPIGKAKEVGFPAGTHHATLNTGGTTMFLQGPLEKNRTGLYRSKRTKVGAEWSKPEPLANLNHPEGERGSMSPSLNADGTRLYFSSDRPAGKGGLDIWSVLVKDLK